MKSLLRSKLVQGTFAFLLATYLRLILATVRWRFADRAAADAAVAAPEGAIACFWHGRIALMIGARPVLKTKPRRVLISLSRDGEFVARAAERMGLPAIRGSAGGPGGANSKGGAAAFLLAVRFIKSGGVILVTPDGPRGPAEVMPSGVVQLARSGDVPVFFLGMAARPAITLSSWDRAQIPLPFTRGCIVFDGPHLAPKRMDEAAIEALRASWQARLIAAQQRAEAIVAGGPSD